MPLHAAVQILEALDAPVIASLQGAVAGGSMSLALSADLAIAAENASFNLAYAASARAATSPAPGSCRAWSACAGRWRSRSSPRRSMPPRRCASASSTGSSPPTARGGDDGPRASPRRGADPRLRAPQAPACAARSRATSPASSHAEREAFCASTGTRDFAEGVAAFFARRKPRSKVAEPARLSFRAGPRAPAAGAFPSGPCRGQPC